MMVVDGDSATAVAAGRGSVPGVPLATPLRRGGAATRRLRRQASSVLITASLKKELLDA